MLRLLRILSKMFKDSTRHDPRGSSSRRVEKSVKSFEDVCNNRQVWPGYWVYQNRDDSISFGTEERDYFGWPPDEITCAVPESLVNTIASMVCHAHRMGRKEAYNFLKQFVLEQMRVPDWPHYPMNEWQADGKIHCITGPVFAYITRLRERLETSR